MMRFRLVSTILFLLVLLAAGNLALAQQKPPENSENLARGKEIYIERCSFCHGLKGNGEGPVADYLKPRPRDFTSGLYKFRTTESGEVPRDEDLFRILTKGLPGTAMQSFAAIPEKERWQVIYYIKKFAPDYFDPKEPPLVAKIGSSPPSSEELIDKGKGGYQKAKCWQCHGQEGRGDGPSAGELKDEWGNPILPADLTKGWQYRGGKTVEEIYRTFTTGINGTPMPSYTDAIPEDERWALAYYVNSIAHSAKSTDVVIRSKKIEGEIPLDPDAELWEKAPTLDVPLSGQVVVAPRWQNHSVDLISVRSLYNDKAIAFLLEWGDRFKDTVHREEPVSVKDTYAKLNPKKKWILRDSMELQFPLKIPQRADHPYFFLGQPDKPVILWRWNADWNEEAKRTPVEEMSATGPKATVAAQPPEGQEVIGKGLWKEGRWRVVLKRPLAPKDQEKDIAFEVGKLIPIAFHVWDGSNGERGLLSAISSWMYLIMEPPTTWWVYFYAVMGTMVAAVGEWWLVKIVKH